MLDNKFVYWVNVADLIINFRPYVGASVAFLFMINVKTGPKNPHRGDGPKKIENLFSNSNKKKKNNKNVFIELGTVTDFTFTDWFKKMSCDTFYMLRLVW